MDARKNFAFSLVATAPSPATSGTQVGLTASTASRFPTVPFNVVAKPFGAAATTDNAEILRVTGISGDIFTVTRAQGGTTAKSIDIGWEIYQGFLVSDKDELATTQFDSNDKPTIESEAATIPVNNVVVKNAATGAAPEIRAKGTDTNIDLAILAKGTGSVKFGTALLKLPNADGTAGQLLKTDGAAGLSWVTPSAGQAVYDAVVAPSGADYTTLGAALAAGKRTIFVKNGTYTETTLNTAWTGTVPLTIIGENRVKTIITLPNSSTGFLNVNYSDAYFANFTLQAGTTSLDQENRGCMYVNSDRLVMVNVEIKGTSATLTNGSLLYFENGKGSARFYNCYFTNENTYGSVVAYGNSNDNLFIGCTWTGTKGPWIMSTGYGAAGASKRWKVMGCTFIGPDGRGGTRGVTFGAYGGSITGNIAFDSMIFTNNEYYFSDTGSATTQLIWANQLGTNNKFNDNLFNLIGTNTRHSAINTNGYDGTTNNEFCGNKIIVTGTVGNGANSPINLSQAVKWKVDDNTIICVSTYNGSYYGIYLDSASDCTCRNNTIIGFNGTSNAAAYLGSATTTLQYGNRIIDCTAGIHCGVGVSTLEELSFTSSTVSGATTTLDVTYKRGFLVSLTASTTYTFTDFPTLSRKQSGEVYRFIFTQNATGGWTVAMPANVIGFPTLTATANAVDYVEMVYRSTDSKYYVTNFKNIV